MEYEEIKEAFHGGFTHAKMPDTIPTYVVSKDESSLYKYAKEILKKESDKNDNGT